MMNNYGNWQFANNNKLIPSPVNKTTEPNMMNPNMTKPNMMNPNMTKPNMMNPNMMDPNMMDPNMMDPNMMNPNMINPGMHGMMKPGMDGMMKPSLSEALELIKQAVEGETEDRLFYDFLIRNAPCEEDRNIISGIRDDEIKHAKMFRQLYFELTGKTIPPNVNVNFEPPRTYCEGLIKALIGETNAVEKYRNILFAMTERRHINMLTEIITDEIRHGILYNLLVHNNDCRY